jgi:hypothetical protein
MKKTLELWSQFAFRIAALTVVGLLIALTAREQNRPEDVDLRDTRYLEKMESYIKIEKIRQKQARPQIADDQRGLGGFHQEVRPQKGAGV